LEHATLQQAPRQKTKLGEKNEKSSAFSGKKKEKPGGCREDEVGENGVAFSKIRKTTVGGNQASRQ